MADTLRLPREDAFYLQTLNEIVKQTNSASPFEEVKVVTPEQLRDHRRNVLAKALADLSEHDEERLVTDALLQACQSLGRVQENLASKQTQVLSTVFKQNLQL